jgi:hypothetical protein
MTAEDVPSQAQRVAISFAMRLSESLVSWRHWESDDPRQRFLSA